MILSAWLPLPLGEGRDDGYKFEKRFPQEMELAVHTIANCLSDIDSMQTTIPEKLCALLPEFIGPDVRATLHLPLHHLKVRLITELNGTLLFLHSWDGR